MPWTKARGPRLDFYIELLRQEGALLGEPYTRQLDGKLRELRFSLRGAGDSDHLLDRSRAPHCPYSLCLLKLGSESGSRLSGHGGRCSGAWRNSENGR